MSPGFKPRLDVLPRAQRRLWHELGPAADLGFVLYGGTAIALRTGHRQSVDFDFFSEQPLDRDAIHANFRFMPASTVLQDQKNTLSVLVADPDFAPSGAQAYVKVSFFGTIGFGRVGEPDWTDDGVLQIASLDDLMATKVKVVLQRAEAKDYRDIAELIRARVRYAAGGGGGCGESSFGPRQVGGPGKEVIQAKIFRACPETGSMSAQAVNAVAFAFEKARSSTRWPASCPCWPATAVSTSLTGPPSHPPDQCRSNRSRFITLVQAATKSRTNFAPLSS